MPFFAPRVQHLFHRPGVEWALAEFVLGCMVWAMKIWDKITPLRVAIIIVAVVVLVIVLDQLVVKRDYAVAPATDVTGAVVAIERDLSGAQVEQILPEIAAQDTPDFAPSLPMSIETPFDVSEADETVADPTEAENLPLTDNSHKKPRVVIIIDDMGVDMKRSAAIVALPAGLTLAYLPYASNITDQTVRASAAGHELIVHVPMEPMSKTQNPGPEVLRVGQDPAIFDQVLLDDLTAFTGYVGINNHMGSRLTQDAAAMKRVMAELKARNLFFIDSRTISNSVAADVAAEMGVPHATRDVFLDHEETDEFVAKSLAAVERKALKDGLAIAIGHPKDVTINGLRAWLPTLADKGIELVPASAVVR